VLHYTEAIAKMPNKRRVTDEMPMIGRDRAVIWKTASDFDSSSILDCFAIEGEANAVETIASAHWNWGAVATVSLVVLSATCSMLGTSCLRRRLS